MNSKPKSQINQDLSDEVHTNSSSKFVFGGKKNGRNWLNQPFLIALRLHELIYMPYLVCIGIGMKRDFNSSLHEMPFNSQRNGCTCTLNQINFNY